MKQIRLSKGLYALVSDDDFDWLNQWNWCASFESRGTKFYAIRWQQQGKKKIKIRMHRVVLEKVLGEPIPEGLVVDHVNHNSLDNTRSNLIAITQAENMRRSPGWKKAKCRQSQS